VARPGGAIEPHGYKKGGTYRTTSQILGRPPGIVLAEVQGKVAAGGKAHVQSPQALKRDGRAPRRDSPRSELSRSRRPHGVSGVV
jgi:hypothetical protein